LLNKGARVEGVEGSYRGLDIHTAANLHRDCIGLIRGLDLPARACALDLGAGAGAFSQRLMDSGFLVTAVEFTAGRFRADADCYNYNLNEDFGDRFPQAFDLVVAIEIIEHLLNPRHFISNCLRALKGNGYLLITSPNPESWLSRIVFLRRGRFLWFDETDYNDYGHIMPIFSWQIEQICNELGGCLLRIEHSRDSLRRRLGHGLVQVLMNKMTYVSALYPLMTGRKRGEINIYLIQKYRGDRPRQGTDREALQWPDQGRCGGL